MITINSGKLSIPEKERFIGFAGDNLHSTKQFIVENIIDKSCIYRLYLEFDDGTVNYFVLDSKVENGSTILTWNVLEEHIFKSGIVIAQIKSMSESGETYHTTRDCFLVAPTAEFSGEFKNNENAEFLRYEKELNKIYEEIKKTDLSSYVTLDRTIAGLTLSSDITADDLYNALKIYKPKSKEGAPTLFEGPAGSFCIDTLNKDLYYCDKRTLSGFNWIKLTGASNSDSSEFRYLSQAQINSAGELELTFNDGTTENLGNVVGQNGYTPTKGTDYFTDEDKSELINSITASLNGVPAYWQTELNDGIKAINEALTTAGYNKSSFLFYSDAHFNYGSQMSPVLLKYLYKNTGLNKTIFGGDIVNNEAYDYDTMEYLWQWRSMLKDLPNHHSVVGNHDDGNTTDKLFSEQYIYGYLLGAEESSDIVRPDEGIYYYIDNPAEKTRYLYLDTAYKGVDNTQLAFIKEALKTTPDKWHIVAIAHTWYQPNYDMYDVRPIPIAGLDTNASKVTALLDAYNNRSGDFSDCGGWVEFCIGGHVHIDYDGTTDTGIPIILVETDSYHTRSGLSATEGTTTEASVNGIVADYDNHKIHIIRIGRGESREVEITNYVVSYTNILSDISIGYQTDREISTTTYEERDSSNGYDLTGYIPISAGDVIRLKNIIMPDNVSDRSNMAYLFNSDKSWANSMCLTTTHEYGSLWKPVFENENLVKFTVPNGYTGMYIRLNASQIDETSIITINEAIE